MVTSDSESDQKVKDSYAFRLNEEILAIIELIQIRSSSYENRRNVVLSLAITIMGVGITALAIYPTDQLESGMWLQPTIVCLIMGGICTFILYFLQSRFPYPFTESVENWRWIYHDIVDSTVPIGPIIKRDELPQIRDKFERDLDSFISRTLNSTSEELLIQNLQQLFTLITYERYKIKFYHQLIKNLGYYLAITFLIFLASFMIKSGPELVNLLLNVKFNEFTNKTPKYAVLIIFSFFIIPIVLGIELLRSRS
jgi:hypothetical protein